MSDPTVTLETMVANIRQGAGDQAITEYLSANPEVSIKVLAKSALSWGLDEVTLVVLKQYIEEHPDDPFGYHNLGLLYLSQARYKDAADNFDAVVKSTPSSPVGYRQLGIAQHREGNLEKVRATIRQAQETIPDPAHVDWQSGFTIPGFSNDEANKLCLEEFEKRVSAEKSCRQKASIKTQENALNPPTKENAESAAYAETTDASEIGRTGLIVGGNIAASELGSTYRFEFGATSTNLNKTTDWKPLPGKLNARFTAEPHLSPKTTRFYGGAVKYADREEPCVMIDWPFGKDPNHISGVGFCELMFGTWHNSCQVNGSQNIEEWESSDLRDAIITFDFSFEDFDSKDFLFCAGIQNDSHGMFMTSAPFEFPSIKEHTEGTVSYTTKAEPSFWSACGNNAIEQENADRYQYGPLDRVLSRHMGNIVFVGLFGNWRDTPTGKFGLRKIDVEYRDRSILHPDSGAKLIKYPASGCCNPLALVDGNRGRLNDGWFQLAPCDRPIEFQWVLPNPMDLMTLVFHQDRVMPTRKCQVTVSTESGESHTWLFELENFTTPSKNDTHLVIKLPGGKLFKMITLELLEAYSDDGIGLEAFEAFAKDYTPPPSSIPVGVSEDLSGMTPGSTVYYRLVCRSGEETRQGDIKEFKIPAKETPFLHHVTVHETTATKSIFRIRGNAMGHQTSLEWKIDDGDWRECPMGYERTAIDRYITARDVAPGDHHLTVRLMTDRGQMNEESISWSQAE